jgi:integrase
MLTVNKALDNYYFEHIKKKCVDARRAEFAIHALKDVFGESAICDIDIPACRDYADVRGVSDSTVRRELGVLHAAAEHAVRWRRLKRDDMPSIELPPESEPRRQWLFKDELAALLDEAESTDEKVFRFCQIAYHTASRKAAIESLRWEQVDLQTRRINLQGAGMAVTKKRRPIVAISEAMAEELTAMKSAATTPWVLGSPAPISNRFQRVAERAKLHQLPQRGLREAGALSPHVLRHSRATHLLEAGKSPFAVASLLGDTVTTVLRVYGHSCPDHMESVVS